MPKRKARETADNAIGPSSKKIITPNANPPLHKKSKKKALAAAKDWHDAPSITSGSVVTIVVAEDTTRRGGYARRLGGGQHNKRGCGQTTQGDRAVDDTKRRRGRRTQRGSGG
jgi:hypothetical protein